MDMRIHFMTQEAHGALVFCQAFFSGSFCTDSVWVGLTYRDGLRAKVFHVVGGLWPIRRRPCENKGCGP